MDAASKPHCKLAWYGALAGLLSALKYIVLFVDPLLSTVWIPGTIFGIVASVAHAKIVKPEPKLHKGRYVVFVLLSTLAFYVAAVITSEISAINITASEKISTSSGAGLAGAVAGFVGSLILVISFVLCGLGRHSLKSALLTIIVGSVTGILMVVFDWEWLGFYAGFFVLFIIWQASVMVCLLGMAKPKI